MNTFRVSISGWINVEADDAEQAADIMNYQVSGKLYKLLDGLGDDPDVLVDEPELVED